MLVPELISSAQVQTELVAPMLSVERKSLEDLSNKSLSAIALKGNPSGFHMLLKGGSHVLFYEEDVETLTNL